MQIPQYEVGGRLDVFLVDVQFFGRISIYLDPCDILSTARLEDV